MKMGRKTPYRSAVKQTDAGLDLSVLDVSRPLTITLTQTGAADYWELGWDHDELIELYAVFHAASGSMVLASSD